MIQHKLSQILPNCTDDRIATSITADSRKACPGCIFVAVRGTVVDGHSFIPQAVADGAIAIVCEEAPAIDLGDAVCCVVPDTAQALGELASAWYGHPSEKLTLVGVTGTNGKTTIATLMYDMARLRGMKAGLLSTVTNKIDDIVVPATHTTPDPLTINQLMSQMVEEGCTFCSMEVSSHAAEQKRIAGLRFAGGIFTNLTRDHLDYHKTMANYLGAKKKFFDGLSPQSFALSNADDKNGEVMLQNTQALRCTYSLQRNADFRCRLIEDRLDGMLISLAISPGANSAKRLSPMAPVEVETSFTGRFNAYNLIAVFGACTLLGWDRDETLRHISMLHPVAGRMQTLKNSVGVTAIIDYAHTPDALTNVLQAINECTKGKIISVIGAGGNRDAGKRPIMAAEAAKLSDYVVITSDNPRNEDPAEIANQMFAGIPSEKRSDVEIILDRSAAITHALGLAKPGDAVLIAGKGHESYQIIGDKTIHFSDFEEVEKNFSNN